MRPAYLYTSKITCLATEDAIGSDDLYGVLGDQTFSLGSYNVNDIQTGVTEQVIPVGVSELAICESDFPDPDDTLTIIDLTQDMDVDRTHGILTGAGRYTIEFIVISEPEEVIDSPCSASCPTCGYSCQRPASHAGTVHWCGQHTWGWN